MINTYKEYLKEIDERKIDGLKPLPIDGAELLSAIIDQIKDLNNDGIDEVITYVSGNLVCGSSGCMSYILQGKEKNWEIIGDLFPGGQNISGLIKSTCHYVR